MRELIFTILAILLEVLIWFLRLFEYISKGLYKLFRFFISRLGRKQQDLFIEINKEAQNPKPKADDKTSKPVIVQQKPVNNVVGPTKTEFVTELPKLKSREPIMSEPLEMESVVETEPDIDPDDVEMDSSTSIMDELADDEDIFPSHQGDFPSDEFSTGVTFEQIEDTINVLSKDEQSEEDIEKAAGVLKETEGTEIFAFFMLQDKYNEKVKKIMEMANTTDTESKGAIKTDFDAGKYIE